MYRRTRGCLVASPAPLRGTRGFTLCCTYASSGGWCFASHPAKLFDRRQGNSPTRNELEVSKPEELFCGGFVNRSNRRDERVEVGSLSLRCGFGLVRVVVQSREYRSRERAHLSSSALSLT